MPQWLAHHLAWITAASIACTVVLTVVGGLIVVLLPPDYFDRSKRQPAAVPGRLSFFQVLLRILKNIVGVLFIAFGILLALPLVPGPGLLFILLGLSMVNLPGKFALERRLIRSHIVLKPINLLRMRFKRPPLTFSHDPPTSSRRLRGEAIP